MKLNALEKKYGKKCKHAFAPIEEGELRVLIDNGNNKIVGRSFVEGSEQYNLILNILQKSICAYGEAVSAKKRKGKGMKINDLAVEVSKLEGMKVNLSIAQIKEVLRCADRALGGELYKLIRKRK